MLTIRPAKPEDAAAFAASQRPYIEHTAINFAYAPPAEEDFLARMAHPYMPFLAAEEDGLVAGFAYASALRTKEAYGWAVELSVYVREDARGRGIGPALYEKLLPLLDRQGYVSAYACITLPNPVSVALHRRFGFREAGVFPACGFKLGAWHDVVWLVRVVSPLPEAPAAVIPAAEAWEQLS